MDGCGDGGEGEKGLWFVFLGRGRGGETVFCEGDHEIYNTFLIGNVA